MSTIDLISAKDLLIYCVPAILAMFSLALAYDALEQWFNRRWRRQRGLE